MSEEIWITNKCINIHLQILSDLLRASTNSDTDTASEGLDMASTDVAPEPETVKVNMYTGIYNVTAIKLITFVLDNIFAE